MSNNLNYKAIFVILDDIEAHGLIHFNKEYLDEEFFKNFLDFQKIFSHTINELLSKFDTFQINHNEVARFTIYSELFYINSHLELMKQFLKIITNPIKLKGGFDENTTLNQMLKRICNKMQYTEKLKNSIRGLFLADFSYAVSNQHYLISEYGDLILYPNDEKMRKSFSIKELMENALQVMTMLDAMLDWSNGKTKPVDKKTDVLDKMINDLIKQVEVLDMRLTKLGKN